MKKKCLLISAHFVLIAIELVYIVRLQFYQTQEYWEMEYKLMHFFDIFGWVVLILVVLTTLFSFFTFNDKKDSWLVSIISFFHFIIYYYLSVNYSTPDFGVINDARLVLYLS